MANKILYTDKEYLINDTTIPDKNKVSDTDMNEIKQVVNNNADELDTATGNISNLQGQVDTNTNDITNIKQEQTTQNNKITSLETDNTTNKSNISNLQGRVASSESAISNLQTNKADKSEIPTDLSQLSNTTTKFVNEIQLNNAVATETTARQNADNNLQSQIDAITVSSDVIDVLGTYQDLLNYDTQHVKMNDLIKVLQDSTHENAMTYYRWTGSWIYVGSEGPYYTKSEADELLQGKVDNTDFNALESTVIGQGQDIVENTSDITVLKGKVSTIETEQTTQNTNIQTNANNITALGNRVSTNETDISNIKTEQTTQNEEIAELKQETKDLRNASYKIYTETPSTNVTLNKTSKNKFIKFGVNGNREQFTSTGRNYLKYNLDILKTNNPGGTWNNNKCTILGVTFTYNEDGSITANGTATSNLNFYLSRNNPYVITTLLSGTYYLTSHETTGSNSTWKTQFNVNGTNYNIFGSGNNKENSVTITEETNVIALIVIYEGQILNNVTFYPMIATTSNAEFEKYTYGQAPNPNYECPISSVGDNGVVNIEKCNKNVIPEQTAYLAIGASGGRYLDSQFRTITSPYTTSANYRGTGFIAKVKPGKTYTFSHDVSAGSTGITIYPTIESMSNKSNILESFATATFTPTQDGYALCSVLASTSGTTITWSYAQLELNTVATPYTPHEKEVFNIPCQKPMRAIGDVRDTFFKNVVGSPLYNPELTTGKWYEMHVIHKYILEASKVYNWSDDYHRFILLNSNFNIKPNSVGNSNVATGLNNVSVNSIYTNSMVARPKDGGGCYIYGWLDGIDSLEDTQNYLTNNEVYIDVTRETPEYLLCTSAQVEVLEAITNSKSYYEQTNGYSNDPVSPILDITAVGDQNLVIDSIDARLSLVE